MILVVTSFVHLGQSNKCVKRSITIYLVISYQSYMSHLATIKQPEVARAGQHPELVSNHPKAYLSIKMSTTTMTLSLTSIRMEELQQQNHSVHLLWSRKLLNFTCWHGHLKGLTHFWSLPREDYERTTVLFFCCCFFFICHWFHLFSPRGCHLDQTHFFYQPSNPIW